MEYWNIIIALVGFLIGIGVVLWIVAPDNKPWD